MKNKPYNHPFFKDRTGQKYITTENYIATVIKYINKNNCTIQLNDWNNTILYSRTIRELKTGKIKNPYHRSVYSIGYLGEGIRDKAMELKWRSMFVRSYSESYHENQPSYKDCSVDPRWHCFQDFAKWYIEKFKSHMNSTWELDKDLLLKGNRNYSSETCCFLPKAINNVLMVKSSCRGKYPIGVVYHNKNKCFMAQLHKKSKNKSFSPYKTPEEAFYKYKIEKERYIKEIADEWKELIDYEAYQALIKYQVEITD